MSAWGRGILPRKRRNAIRITVWSVGTIFRRRTIGFYRRITY
jgi:hypothetical protein